MSIKIDAGSFMQSIKFNCKAMITVIVSITYHSVKLLTSLKWKIQFLKQILASISYLGKRKNQCDFLTNL